jgi:3-phosphoshikimate 1-carboxyvinyltransferase
MSMSDIRRVEKLDHELNAVVSVPGSKSIANRALICAALADGVSEVNGVPDGDDTEAMIECLNLLGARIERMGTTVTFRSAIDLDRKDLLTLDARLAGTTARFLTAVCGLISGPTLITGQKSLLSRPMNDLHQALLSLGVQVEWKGDAGNLPAVVHRGKTSGSTVELPGTISSQFTSALMLISPALPLGLSLSILGEVISQPYIDMTASVMRHFGARVEEGVSKTTISSGGYRGSSFHVEPDASSSSYPLAAAAIVGGSVEIVGLGKESIQGDAKFAELLSRMGCDVEYTQHSVSVRRVKSRQLQGIDVDMRDMSDLVPTLAAIAVYASTPTTIRGVGFIRSKESNRIDDLVHELRSIGVDAIASSDGLIVHPSEVQGGLVETHHDHRLAMAFALIGLGSGGVSISDPTVVKKSWPGYWSMLEGL